MARDTGLIFEKTERAEAEKFIIKTQGQERIHVLYRQQSQQSKDKFRVGQGLEGRLQNSGFNLLGKYTV